MTVKEPVNDLQVRDNSGSDLQKSKEFLSPKVPFIEESIGGKKLSEREFNRSPCGKSKVFATDLQTDQESIESSEEMESPRSVTRLGKWTPKEVLQVHSQILRIRKEDSHLREDIGEGFSAKDKLRGHHHQLASSHMDDMLFLRPILRASPLSGKTVH